MPTVTVPRSNVTADQVREVLCDKLPPRYTIALAMTSRGFAKEVPDDANALLVRGPWLARANIRIIAGADNTEIDIRPGASYPGLIRFGDLIGIVRTVHRALADSGDLTRSN